MEEKKVSSNDSNMGEDKNPGENSNEEHSEATAEDLEGKLCLLVKLIKLLMKLYFIFRI